MYFKASHIRSINYINNAFKIHFRSLSSNKNSDLNLKGIFPPIPTPFNADESIAYDKLESNFQKWNKIPFKGYLVEGTNGEFVGLSSEERIKLIKFSKKVKSPDKILLAGSGCESTKETIHMTTKMAEAGADAVMVVTPSYFKAKMTSIALFKHYEKVANTSPIPVILYNVPGNTGVDMTVDVIVDLSQHHNIIGMKESGGDISKIGEILHRTSNMNFQVLAGSAGFLLASLQLGCVGGVCALANVLGEEVCELYQQFVSGNKNSILLQKKLIAPNAAVTKVFSVPGLKLMMDLKGYFGGQPRLPLQPLSETEAERLKAAFSSAGYL